MNIIYTIVLLAIVIALIIALIANNKKNNELAKQSSTLNAENAKLNEQVNAANSEKERLNNELEQAQAKNNELQQQSNGLIAENTRLTEQVRILGDEQRKLRDDSKLVFRDIASQVIEEQRKQFKADNETRLNEILSPFRQNIDTLKTAINSFNTQQASYTAALKQQITDLANVNRDIGREAKDLTNALRGNSKVQGDWGEMMLNRILDMSGLEKGVNYDTQVTAIGGEPIKSENGGSLRPDVIFFLPDNKNLVIDSKVSLTAFNEWVNATDDATREAALKRHIDSVRRHVSELANKEYNKHVKNSADFVLMFIPNESAYLVAMQSDNDLWQWAYKQQVVIVSPTHLISVVRLIAQLWAREKQARNAVKIAEQAGRLYDKLCSFVDDFKKIQTGIDAVQKNYNSALKRLAEERGNIISQAEKMKKLGAKANKQLPEPKNASIDDEDEADDNPAVLPKK